MTESNEQASQGRGRVIAFEGVDGAGKSTVLKIVAEHLRSTGVEVYLPRVGKEHRARPVREVRRLTRDRRNYELRPRAELLLYAAREAQVLDQHVRPALARGATVLLDRSMLTPLVLGVYGRGLELGPAEAICAAASAGIEPDHTLIFDVDPRTSRIRKRLDKARNDRWRDGGRKGLAGSGFKQRIRDGYLELAARDGLPVFHAERSGPQEVAARVIALLERGVHDEPAHDRRPSWLVDPTLGFADALATLPPLLQLYFTRGLAIGRPIRAQLFASEPRLAVWATDFDDPLLERAAGPHPGWVLARIANAEARGFERTAALADELRARLIDADPELVARSLARVAGPEADELRTRLSARAPGGVVESLLGRSDAFACELRAELWSEADSYERARSLQHCEHDAAWKKRAKLLDADPAVALPSFIGLDPARVDP
ncbi:MAG: thymidylate kinase, partial [Myxococcales bacterium]|nr:thymidylate kinase [Myxococcales bacterium]